MSEQGALSILFLSSEYPPETGWGGIGTYTYNMAKALAQRGHEVHVLSVAPGQPERHYLDGLVHVHRFPQRELWKLRSVRSAPMPIPHLEKALSTYLAHRRLGIEFDVIEYSEWSAEGLLFSLLRNKPTVAHLHASLPLRAQQSGIKTSIPARLAGYLEGLSIRRADTITSPSQALADWTTNHYRLEHRPVVVIRHPAPAPNEISDVVPVEASGQKRVLFVGRLEFNKNPEVIVRAAKSVCGRLGEAEFIFAGGSRLREGVQYREWLTELAGEYGVSTRIHFAGHQERQEVEDLQRSATIIVVPSRWENFPSVVMEAMIAARPIVASRVGGIPEMIRDGETGLLVDPEDREGWAQALIALLTDPERACRMGQQAQEDALDRFHPAKIAAQRETIYREAIRLHQKRQKRQQHDRQSCL
jgi:glycosyltransferase involved in cell wall biosynthesis